MCSVDTATVGREGGKPDVRDVERGQAGEIWAQLSNDPDDWPATTVITLDPSEEMTRAAEDELKVRQIQ